MTVKDFLSIFDSDVIVSIEKYDCKYETMDCLAYSNVTNILNKPYYSDILNEHIKHTDLSRTNNHALMLRIRLQ